MQRLSFVTLGVRDLSRLRAFYSGALGWSELPGADEHWVAYLVGGVILSLYPSDALAEEAGTADTASAVQKGELFTLGCNVESREQVDVVFSEWLRAGAVVGAAPTDRPWGGRSGYVFDPEGNVWEIAWAPGLRFGDRGEVVALLGDTD